MICKECGAYNPDHATYCKVCAANLKGDPAPKADEAPEQEQQTKRFSRPSWVVPEQADAAKQQAVEAADEAIEGIEQNVEESVPATEELRSSEEEPAEESIPAWNPAQTRRRSSDDADTEESEDVEASEPYEEENDGIYNDEESLEEEENSFEYEPTPPKRKQQKKKNNTMFTILLIAIIVVIVAALVVGGIFLIKKLKEKGGADDANRGSSQTINQDGTNPEQSSVPGEPGTATPAPTSVPEADAQNAVLQEYIDDAGKDMLAITVLIPAKSTIVIDFPNQEDYQFVNSDENDTRRIVRIPAEIFYKNAPLEEETVEFTPDIRVTKEDGTSFKVACASFKRTFPKLTISITEPVPNDTEIIMAPEGNVVQIRGTVSPAPDPLPDAVTINGVGTTVYEDGSFMYEYKLHDGIGEDESEEVTIVARKNNYVIDTETLTIYAYKFIPEPMKLEVKNDASTLRADKSGKITVTGTTLPGATLTATSDNASDVLCGSVTVDNDGNFSFQISMESEFYGMSVITLDAVKEGAESGSTKFTVTKGFEDYKAFQKYYQKTKSYIEVNIKDSSSNTFKISDLLANVAQYANNSYGFRVSATVTEVIENDGDMIVKMTILKTNEVVYVHNLSTKWTPGENVGSKYNVYGNFVGTYGDTGCCEFLGWFARVIK